MTLALKSPEDAPKPVVSVLMIDDDESEFELVKPALTQSRLFDYRLSWAPGYKDGYRMLAGQNFDVCLLDYNLGMETGLDLMRQVRRSGITVPIILLTGTSDDNIDYLVMKEGAEDYLRKDQVNAQSLERSIRYAVLRQKMQTELLATREEKSQFISFIAHELRAPLHNMLATAEEAREVHEYEYHLADMAEMAQYLLSQVNDLLDFNELDKTMARRLHETIFEVPQAVDKAVFFIKNFAKKQKVMVSSKLEDKLPELKADLRLVRQMLINLLYNALKHGRDITHIYVKAYLDDPHIVIEVADDGKGMTKEAWKNIDALQSASGLGLPIVKHFISLHGGQLEIKPGKEKGTVATLTFPSERVIRNKNSILDVK